MNRKKILFFIGTLGSGGKERRLIELLAYLKNNANYEMLVVLRRDRIHYERFFELDIPFELLTKKYKKKDISLPFRFFKITNQFKPDLIHVWGRMPAFVSLLTVMLKGIPLINSQITSAPPHIEKLSFNNLINKINFKFSDVILSNSEAGLQAYNPPLTKSKVIYNGIDKKRFEGLPPADQVKKRYFIKTKHLVIMVASFSAGKDYSLFLDCAEHILKERDDVTFACIGEGKNIEKYKKQYIKNPYIIFTGRLNDVEPLVNASDIGVLLTNRNVHGEGISNAITEYMALGKPVIANDAGGTKEIIKNGENGYLIKNESLEVIAKKILELIDKPQKRIMMGKKGREIIEQQFAVEKMGKAFNKVYQNFLE